MQHQSVAIWPTILIETRRLCQLNSSSCPSFEISSQVPHPFNRACTRRYTGQTGAVRLSYCDIWKTD